MKYVYVCKFPVASLDPEQDVESRDLTHAVVCVCECKHNLFEHLGLGRELVPPPWVVVCCCAGLSLEAALAYSAMINYSPC